MSLCAHVFLQVEYYHFPLTNSLIKQKIFPVSHFYFYFLGIWLTASIRLDLELG